MRLWIGNMAPGTTEAELKAFLAKYAPGMECLDIEYVKGEGTHPAAIVRLAGGTTVSLEELALRLDGMYWKERALNVSAEPG
jgi:hypothetical protein